MCNLNQVFWEEPDVSNLPTGDLSLARALWISGQAIAFQIPSEQAGNVNLEECQYSLHYSYEAGIGLTADGLTNSDGNVNLTFRPEGVLGSDGTLSDSLDDSYAPYAKRSSFHYPF